VYGAELGTKSAGDVPMGEAEVEGHGAGSLHAAGSAGRRTGCGVCVEVCPVKNKSDVSKKALNMAAQEPLRAAERDNWEFLPEPS